MPGVAVLYAILGFSLLGDGLRSVVREQARRVKTIAEFEERSFDALFEFLCRVPGYHRIFSEAETLAQVGFEKHLRVGREE
jgi:hypothetical protein